MNALNAESGWQEITDQSGINELMRLFGNFHDGCVREIHVATGHSVGDDLSMSCDWRTTVHVLVQRQVHRPSAIEMRFEEVAALQLSPPPPDYVSIIFRAAFVLHEGMFYWSEDSNWSLESTPDRAPMIAARRVWWRDASKWMGSTLRYKAAEDKIGLV